MKKIISKIGLVHIALVLGVAWFFSCGAPLAEAKDANQASKAKYLVMSSHTPEQCLKALDEVKSQGDKMLGKYDWGCMAGDHSGYMMVTAASDADALNMVPESMRGSAKAVKLNKFTAAQIQSFHDKK